MLNSTKGIVLIPSFYRQSFLSVGRYAKLLSKLREDFGYEIRETDEFSDPSYDVVVVLKSPNKGAINLLSGVGSLPKTTKVVMYIMDLHSQEEIDARKVGILNKAFDISMRKMCGRADIILCPYKTAFLSKYGEFRDKLIFFPHFVDDEYVLKARPKNSKCLVSGATCAKVYPLRTKLASYAFSNAYKNKFSFLPHPGYMKAPTSNDIVGHKYLDYLSGFTCAIATPSIFDYTVAKYFEIPAAGTLLVAKASPDLEELGFIDGKNFICIDDKNALDKVTHILYSTSNYDSIRDAGRELVLSNYTKTHAYRKLVSYIENLF